MRTLLTALAGWRVRPLAWTACPVLLAVLFSGCGGSSGGSVGSGGAPDLPAPGASAAASAPTAPPATALAGWTLVWSDEFDVDGLPNAAKWDYDTERNRAGWYNNELQYYARDRLENARVTNGTLIITARKERLSGASDYGNQNYTSARMLTRGKASWTYGFFEVRAKLPCGLGTWPAIWTLGTGGRWPEDGEIDIMEQLGKVSSDKTVVLGTIHNQASRAGQLAPGVRNGASTPVSDACTAFHNYQLTWTAERIAVGVDNAVYFEYLNPGSGGAAKWPFANPQYLLLNLAMGGDLGGAVPAAFVSDQMEIDYVRVYQR